MEIITLEKDIPVMCITASSFPDRIMAAHQQLHEQVPFTTSAGTSPYRDRKTAAILYTVPPVKNFLKAKPHIITLIG